MPGAHLSQHGLHAETLSSVDQAAVSEAAISLSSAFIWAKACAGFWRQSSSAEGALRTSVM